ncbi:MAG: nitroreductase family protein [Thermoanaerobaculaceae bacterium]|jgi:nitroreductase|nr:nitroreductase family protein [Thermoanaerobaculaceae bacterium]
MIAGGALHGDAPSPGEVERLLEAAVWAPSGDNTQPWRFEYDAGRRAIDVVLDPARDRSPMNAGQQMALIACGAAVENVSTLAAAHGRRVTVEVCPADGPEVATRVASVVLGGQRPVGGPPELEAAVRGRVSNRRVFDGRPLDAATRSSLERATAELPGVQVRLVTDRALVRQAADRIARGDTVMFADPAMRHAFLGNVRFDLPRNATADEGMSLGSLEAAAHQRLALRAMRFTPDLLFALSGGARMLGAYTRKLVRSSAGLALVVPTRDPWSDTLGIGRAAQRVWLELSRHGLATQPMMSLPGLRFALAFGAPDLVRSLTRLGAPQALRELERMLASAGLPGMPAFMLRFGYAPPPTARVGRRRPG